MKRRTVFHWKKIETALRRALPKGASALPIRDTAEYPLAFNVEMPEGYPYRNGNIGFQFSAFTCRGSGAARLKMDSCRVEGSRIQLCLEWKEVHLSSRYIIRTKQAPVIDLDTAGNMLGGADRELMQAAGAKAQRTPGLTADEQNAFLDNAREQRTRLMETPNGQQLMGIYNEHNEIYNEVFVKSDAARSSWVAGGATAEMAKDTHDAVKNNTVVNSGSKTYTGGGTYNSNAFVQQLNIVVNSANIDPNFNIFDPDAKPDPDSKYIKASLAALSFGKAVHTTGNNAKQSTPLSKEDVYQHVDSFSQAAPTTSIDELQNLLSQGSGSGGAGQAAAPDWIVLDEEQRKMVRHWIHMSVRQKASEKKNVSRPLWKGRATARIQGLSMMVELLQAPESGDVEVKDCRLDLPAFALDIDDAAWKEPTAGVVRERLAHIYFVKDLIAGQVASGIKAMISKAPWQTIIHTK